MNMRPVDVLCGAPAAATHYPAMSRNGTARSIAVAEIAVALEAAGADDPHRLADVVFDVLEPNHLAWWSRRGQETIPSWSTHPLPVDAQPLFSFRKRTAWSAAIPKLTDGALKPTTVEAGDLTFVEASDGHTVSPDQELS